MLADSSINSSRPTHSTQKEQVNSFAVKHRMNECLSARLRSRHIHSIGIARILATQIVGAPTFLQCCIYCLVLVPLRLPLLPNGIVVHANPEHRSVLAAWLAGWLVWFGWIHLICQTKPDANTFKPIPPMHHHVLKVILPIKNCYWWSDGKHTHTHTSSL